MHLSNQQMNNNNKTALHLFHGSHLRRLGIRGLADLVLALLGEANAEDTKHKAISGLHISEALNKSLPLLD